MRVLQTGLEGVIIIEPDVHGDERGFFQESWKSSTYADHGVPASFSQANVSRSVKGTLRGLHFQHPEPQGKLVSVLEGCIFDVAVDIRVGSPSFGKWAGVELSATNHRQLYVPEDFAHGFMVTSETALFHYHCSREYAPRFDAAIAWDDPDIGISWPATPGSISDKDRKAPRLADISQNKLPRYR